MQQIYIEMTFFLTSFSYMTIDYDDNKKKNVIIVRELTIIEWKQIEFKVIYITHGTRFWLLLCST